MGFRLKERPTISWLVPVVLLGAAYGGASMMHASVATADAADSGSATVVDSYRAPIGRLAAEANSVKYEGDDLTGLGSPGPGGLATEANWPNWIVGSPIPAPPSSADIGEVTAYWDLETKTISTVEFWHFDGSDSDGAWVLEFSQQPSVAPDGALSAVPLRSNDDIRFVVPMTGDWTGEVSAVATRWSGAHQELTGNGWIPAPTVSAVATRGEPLALQGQAATERQVSLQVTWGGFAPPSTACHAPFAQVTMRSTTSGPDLEQAPIFDVTEPIAVPALNKCPGVVVRAFSVPWDFNLMAADAGTKMLPLAGLELSADVDPPLRFTAASADTQTPQQASATTETVQVSGQEVAGAAWFRLDASASDADATTILKLGQVSGGGTGPEGYDLVDVVCTSGRDVVGESTRRIGVEVSRETGVFYLTQPIGIRDAVQCDLYYQEHAPLEARDLLIAASYDQGWQWDLAADVTPPGPQAKPDPADDLGAQFQNRVTVTSTAALARDLTGLAEVTFYNYTRSVRSLNGVVISVPGAATVAYSDQSGQIVSPLSSAQVPAATPTSDADAEFFGLDGTGLVPGTLTLYLDLTYSNQVEPVLAVTVPDPTQPSVAVQEARVSGTWLRREGQESAVVLADAENTSALRAALPRFDPQAPEFEPLVATEGGRWELTYPVVVGGSVWSGCWDYPLAPVLWDAEPVRAAAEAENALLAADQAVTDAWATPANGPDWEQVLAARDAAVQARSAARDALDSLTQPVPLVAADAQVTVCANPATVASRFSGDSQRN